MNPDGSTTFEGSQDSTVPPMDEETAEGFGEKVAENLIYGVDPAIILLAVAVVVGLLVFLWTRRSKDDDDFFSNLDGEKVRHVWLTTTTDDRKEADNLTDLRYITFFNWFLHHL